MVLVTVSLPAGVQTIKRIVSLNLSMICNSVLDHHRDYGFNAPRLTYVFPDLHLDPVPQTLATPIFLSAKKSPEKNKRRKDISYSPS